MKKLVRDNIPDIIRKSGAVPVTRTLNHREFMQSLKSKVLEEAKELHEATAQDAMLAELGDLQELVLTICRELGFSKEDLEEARVKKAAKNGAFKKRIFLEEIREA